MTKYWSWKRYGRTDTLKSAGLQPTCLLGNLSSVREADVFVLCESA